MGENVSSRRFIVQVRRWSFYLLVPGKLHIQAHPWYVHVCRCRV